MSITYRPIEFENAKSGIKYAGSHHINNMVVQTENTLMKIDHGGVRVYEIRADGQILPVAENHKDLPADDLDRFCIGQLEMLGNDTRHKISFNVPSSHARHCTEAAA